MFVDKLWITCGYPPEREAYMSGSHGDLFNEIGRLVVAADAGQAIDLRKTSQELAQRYSALGVPADAMARAIARSLGAIGVSMAMMSRAEPPSEDGEPEDTVEGAPVPAIMASPTQAASILFPSGLRLAVLA